MPQNLRCEGDQVLLERLRGEPLVKRALSRIERAEAPRPDGVRRKLLSTALRLTQPMAPAVAKMMDACVERLGVEIPLETYVYSSPHFNAACVKPEDGRLFILLSSSLLEAFEGDELKFVLGHELGHYVFGHHDIPIGMILEGSKPPASLALRLFAWSRYAEISADRAGAACAVADGGSPDGIAQALFRLASGLREDIVELRIDDFAAQIEDIQAESEGTREKLQEGREDWFSTHPFSPLRLKAVKLFLDVAGPAKTGVKVADKDRPALEAEITTLMALMEPSYLEEQSETAETMRRLLFAGAIAVADASEGINKQEKEVFEGFFGEGSLGEALDVTAIKAALPKRIEAALERVPHARRIQVLRDLALVARADGRVAPKERKVIEMVAAKLEVPKSLIDKTLNADLSPD